MKRIYTQSKWVAYSTRRRSKLEERRIASKLKKIRRNRRTMQDLHRAPFQGSQLHGTNTQSRRHETVRVVLPVRLDPMINDHETVAACKNIIRHVEDGGKEVFVDMSAMSEFTLAGVIYLSASIDRARKNNGNPPTLVRGNFPDDERATSEFLESGFFHGFSKGNRHLPPPKASWTRARERKVASRKAAELVDFAQSRVDIPHVQLNAIWQNLVECMTNTHNHARGRSISQSRTQEVEEPAEQWIAGVMCDNGIAYFSFVDLGVGICESVQAKSWLGQARDTLVGYGPDNLVRDAFRGILGSSTGERGRGLGLPRMRRDAQRGLLQDLHVRTGLVEGNIAPMSFRRVAEDLQGTILTWTASANGGQ